MILECVLVSDHILNLGLILSAANYAVLGCSSSRIRWFLPWIFMNRSKCSYPLLSLEVLGWLFCELSSGTLSGLHQGIKLSFVRLSLGDDLQEFCYVKNLCSAQSVSRVKPSPRRYLIEVLSLAAGYLFWWIINFAASASWVEWSSAGPYEATAQCGTV